MKVIRTAGVQLRSNYTVIFGMLILSAVLVGLVYFVHIWKNVPTENLTRDPNSIAKLPFYNGFLSQVGLFLWAATAAITLFYAYILSKQATARKLRIFLGFSGAITLMLGFDDAFLLHEEFFPGMGIPEKLVIFSYLLIIIFYLISFRTTILNSEFILLAIAFLFFGISVIIDKPGTTGFQFILIEDGSKLTGILFWLFYFSRIITAELTIDTRQNKI
ncbi:MAG: hypothetical protein JXJ22_17820 [Bacteroidales bacterium]|nr:hypothetical protein [Bacteroidales bacterium]